MRFSLHLTSLLLGALGTEACLFHGDVEAEAKRLKRDPHFSPLRRSQAAPTPSNIRTAITNVRVFDGVNILEPATVLIQNDLILEPGVVWPNDTIVDAQGGVLLPGLIDAHCHPGSVADLEALSSFGVTTAISMSCLNYTLCAGLRQQPGLASYFTAGYPALGPGSSHALSSKTPADQLIYNAAQAASYVDYVAGNGSDYLKITSEVLGPDQATQNALVGAAHARGLLAMTHASALLSYQQAIFSKTDGIQHMPIDGNLTSDYFELMVKQNQFGTPTMEVTRLTLTLAAINPSIGAGAAVAGTATSANSSYSNWKENVKNMHLAGVPILAGTDAVPQVTAVLNGTNPFGWTLHNELLNLVEAGLSPAESLRAATELAAQKHQLGDRGKIAPGMRADLVLLQPGANPLMNITDTRKLAKIWVGGFEYKNVASWNQSIYDLEFTLLG